MKNKTQQQGAVLVSALLIMALSAMLSVLLLLSQRLLIRQASLMIHADQMYLYLQGVQAWANQIIVHQADLQQTPSLDKKLHGMSVTGKLYAQEGLFNINALARKENFPRFVRLLQVVQPDLPIKRALDIASEINQWLLPSDVDNYYLHLHLPYRAAHQMIVNVSELRSIRGMTSAIFTALKPYLTALPDTSFNIDINYAPVPVLMTLTDQVTLAQAQAWFLCRKEHGRFQTIADYLQICGANALKNSQEITTEEHYYLLYSCVTYGEQRLTLVSMMSPNVIIWQEMNPD